MRTARAQYAVVALAGRGGDEPAVGVRIGGATFALDAARLALLSGTTTDPDDFKPTLRLAEVLFCLTGDDDGKSALRQLCDEL